MKIKFKHLPIIGALAIGAASLSTSCTDKLAFGDSFLEKAPGGSMTADSIFSNAQYTRYYLAGIYAKQYYNLPVGATNDLNTPQWYNYFKGIPDILSDSYHQTYASLLVFGAYYNGMLSSAEDGNRNYNIYPYHHMGIWESIRGGFLLMENIDRVPGMSQDEKERIKDECKCLIAATYFNAFRWYGGLPIVRQAYSGDESEYVGRATAMETVDYMIELLDEVIANNNLPWSYTETQAASEAGHWTLAGAMAQKIQILLFAASPLLNSNTPYYEGKYTMEIPELVWMGGYKPELWTRLKTACEDFFSMMNSKGGYHLVVPLGDTPEDYAYAFRSSYMLQDSPEVLHSVRCSNYAKDNNYVWQNLGWGSSDAGDGNDRVSVNPTQEYVEMFPWADGTPFDWDKAEAEGKLDEMFVKGEKVYGQRYLQNLQYTRDPRLYETIGCNNVPAVTEWSNGNRSGQPFEFYVGGTLGGQMPVTNSGYVATGYRNIKYLVGVCFRGQTSVQWVPLLLSDVYLTYAEAILQSGGNLSDAIKQVDAVRARVGMKGLVECNPDKNLTSDKDALLNEILRERACEFALQQTRYFDMIRYKMTSAFEKPLHGLRMYRMVNGKRNQKQWYNDDLNNDALTPDDDAFYQPYHFEYEKFEITTGARIWWKEGFDPKWYFQPFPITEVNKGYGLYQNPGW